MGLTSTAFFVVTLLLLVAAPAAMAAGWNRIPGPAAVRYGGRAVLAVIAQAAAVLAVLVWVNDSYGLYDNWGDLLGSDSGPVRFTSGSDVRGLPPGAPVHPLGFKRSSQGVLTARATGRRSGITGDVLVWLPPQYTDPAYRTTRFPVVELLPGYPGTPRAWFSAMAVQKQVGSMIAEHRARPMILVAAKMNVLGNRDPGCADLPGGSRTATWLGADVPELVAGNFRTAPGPRQWSVMGYSAGGYCAVNLALHYPQVFHSAVSLSGYNAPIARVVTRDAAVARANNLYRELHDARPQPPVALLMAGSYQDTGTVPDAVALLGALHDPGESGLLTVSAGGHNTRVWRRMLPAAFTWISTETAPRRPAPGRVPRRPAPVPGRGGGPGGGRTGSGGGGPPEGGHGGGHLGAGPG